MTDPKTRFSERVAAYAKHRPSYPPAILDHLRSRFALSPGSTIADIGSGTGVLTAALLDLGVRVHAVEPNEAMRAESDAHLSTRPDYTSHAGSAEETTLPSASVDLITAAQAFHWFDRERSAREFARILAPDGGIALVWNRRDDAGSALLAAYEAMLQRRLPEYSKVNHKGISDEELLAWLGDGAQKHEFPNAQTFDLAGLRGRLMSSSYCPTPDDPGFDPLMDELASLFDRFSSDGTVAFAYRTQLYTGEASGLRRS